MMLKRGNKSRSKTSKDEKGKREKNPLFGKIPKSFITARQMRKERKKDKRKEERKTWSHAYTHTSKKTKNKIKPRPKDG